MEKVFELSRRIVGEHKSLYEKLAGKLVPVG
jgi:hypothetical protein